MSTSITLKNIPDPIYQRIKLAAKRHHRSMNNEIIACLEQALAPQPVDIGTRLDRARRLRTQFRGPDLKVEDIASAIDRDRQ
ncbi:MAG: Arc family DNA-binding protein [Gammaproteobacteria bacterium]|nr:MAG: Arc family DNA-binding protein [Gammaproteobacteria bacterium]